MFSCKERMGSLSAKVIKVREVCQGNFPLCRYTVTTSGKVGRLTKETFLIRWAGSLLNTSNQCEKRFNLPASGLSVLSCYLQTPKVPHL